MKNRFLTYKEGQKIASSIGIKSANEWYKYASSGKKSSKIPSSPNTVYKDKGWNGWREWLGYGFLDFYQSKCFVHKLKLKSCKEWKEYIKGKDIMIPHDPQSFYKDKGWNGWREWLGYDRKFDQNRRKYKINNNFFKYWTHDMAYILGLWWADGCICEKQYRFEITLHKKDSYLFEQIAMLMNVDLQLIKYNNCYSFVISSKNIYRDIIALGGTPKKSLMLIFPKIPEKYIADFIRGYFDGDGSIFYAKNDSVYYASFSCGSERFLFQLEQELKKQIDNFKCYIYSRYRDPIIRGKKYKDIFSSELKMNANITKRFGEYIYDTPSQLRMIRKYEKFQKIGKIKIANKDKVFRDFGDAREFVNSMGFKNTFEWGLYCKSGKKSFDIPSHPEKIYKNNGWIDWYDWLGKEKPKTKVKQR